MRAVCIPGVQFQGDISSDRTVLAPATALPWINEAVLAANASSRPGQTQTGVRGFVAVATASFGLLTQPHVTAIQVIARHLLEHGLRVEVWPWKYVPEDGRTVSHDYNRCLRLYFASESVCGSWSLTNLHRVQHCCREKKLCWFQCKKPLMSVCTTHWDAKPR